MQMGYNYVVFGHCDDRVSAGIWVTHTGPKSGGVLVTLFGGYCDDRVSAGIWVIHTGPKYRGHAFWRLL